MVLEDTGSILADHLPPDIREFEAGPHNVLSSASHPLLLPEGGLRLEDVERDLIRQALVRTGGNITQAGELLGLHRDTLRYRARKYDVLGDS